MEFEMIYYIRRAYYYVRCKLGFHVPRVFYMRLRGSGKISKNYYIICDKCWKILRIEGEGSVK